MAQGYQPPPQDPGTTMQSFRAWMLQAAQSLRVAMQGGLNVTGEVTLTPLSATTTLTDPRLTVGSAVVFTPLSANAKAEGTPWASARNDGAWTLSHANNAQADRTYRYAILG